VQAFGDPSLGAGRLLGELCLGLGQQLFGLTLGLGGDLPGLLLDRIGNLGTGPPGGVCDLGGLLLRNLRGGPSPFWAPNDGFSDVPGDGAMSYPMIRCTVSCTSRCRVASVPGNLHSRQLVGLGGILRS
jgi:hypothetical protein